MTAREEELIDLLRQARELLSFLNGEVETPDEDTKSLIYVIDCTLKEYKGD